MKYGSIICTALALVFAFAIGSQCTNQPDMGGQLVYGLIVLPVAGILLLVSAALAVTFYLRTHGHRRFMITMLALDVTLALGFLFAGTYM